MNLGDLQSRIVEQEENVSLKHLIFWDLPSTVAKPEREVSCQRYRLQERKWAVKNGVKEAYKDITGKKPVEDEKNEKELEGLVNDSQDAKI